MQPNEKTVYVVQADSKKDLSDAKRYGNLLAVFGNPRKPYNTDEMISKARRMLSEWKEGDYLLMLGDPTLCGVCMSVAAEYTECIDILSWDRNTFCYIPQEWDFSAQQYQLGLDVDGVPV
tara:strand:- start:6588 stop:6947 length:360 start_codon:yes stop_codon:yes gene_type:complete